MQVEVTSMNKFDSYVKGIRGELEQEKEKLNDRLSKLSQMVELEKEPTAQNVLKAREGLLLLDPTLDNAIRIIDFFSAHNALDVDQVQMALNTITQGDYFEKRVLLESKGKDQVHQVEEDIQKIGAVLRREKYDFDYFLTLLDKSGLKEQEQLDVLTKEAWDSCSKTSQKKKRNTPSPKENVAPITVIEPKEEANIPPITVVEPPKEKEEPIIVVKEEDTVSPTVVEPPQAEPSDIKTTLRERYESLSKEMATYLNQYAYLYQGKSDREIELAKNLAACEKEMKMMNGTEEIDTTSFSYVEERLTVQLLELSMYKEELHEIFNDEGKNTESLEAANFYLDLIEDLLKSVKESASEYSLEKQETTHPSASKIFFFLDKGNPCFDLAHFNASEKKRMQMLIDRLERGIEDPEMSSRHIKVIKDQKTDYDMYVVKSSNTACCYTRAGNDSLVILTFAPMGEIFDQAKYVSRRYEQEINEFITKVKEKDAKTLGQASLIREEMDQALLPKGGIQL